MTTLTDRAAWSRRAEIAIAAALATATSVLLLYLLCRFDAAHAAATSWQPATAEWTETAIIIGALAVFGIMAAVVAIEAHIWTQRVRRWRAAARVLRVRR